MRHVGCGCVSEVKIRPNLLTSIEIEKFWTLFEIFIVWAGSFRVDTHTNPRIIPLPLPDLGFLGEGLWSRRGDAAATGMVGMVVVGGAGGTWKFGAGGPVWRTSMKFKKKSPPTPNPGIILENHPKIIPEKKKKNKMAHQSRLALRSLLCKVSTVLTLGRSAARRSKADLAGPLECRGSRSAFSTSSSGSESRDGSNTALAWVVVDRKTGHGASWPWKKWAKRNVNHCLINLNYSYVAGAQRFPFC